MADAIRTHLELHQDLLDLAKMAVKQVQDNPAPQNHVLPGVDDVTTAKKE